jgi:oligoendopeptidase F
MFNVIPKDPAIFMNWSWPQLNPYYQDLIARELDELNIDQFLRDWTRLIDLVSEIYARVSVSVTSDTMDEKAEKNYNRFLEQVYPESQAANQQLKEKLLVSGLEPDGFHNPLRKMRAEAEIYRSVNLPLLTEERKMGQEYNKIIGAQSVRWRGEELTLQQLRPHMQTQDRQSRERIWRSAAERQLADRQIINDLWIKQIATRIQLAENADLPNYRTYRWSQMTRLDYTPEDCLHFHRTIEAVAVPAATRLYEKHRNLLGEGKLRPWDLDLDLYPLHFPPISPYGQVDILPIKAENIFSNVAPILGEYFHVMREDNLLDLENRKGKAPGAYCTNFPVIKRPFIFMNAVGIATDVRTILHESGHAFHNFERFRLPYAQQRTPGLEFAEVASMGLELLASPYLTVENGGFYTQEDSVRFRVQHLERILAFWPYMAVVDAFQHWVYTHEESASNPANCDAKWYELWLRFIPGVDWNGLEAEVMTGWHRKQHIHRAPFYYVEYGLAQLGAVQVWKHALKDQAETVENYRKALSLGGTATLPELYRTAGAKFAFDKKTLGKAVKLIERKIQELESGEK